VVALITFTAIVGTLLASPGWPPLDALILGNLGIALAAACAATINHVLDRRIDEQMARTRGRPFPTGAMKERQALIFAAVPVFALDLDRACVLRASGLARARTSRPCAALGS